MSVLLRIAGVGLAAVLISACTTSGATGAPPSTPPVASTAAPAGGVTLGMATTSLGAVLVGPTGLTLYTHAGDSSTSSTCTGGCAGAWPPLTVAAGQQMVAGPGVTGQLGTLVRPEGTTQVTYDGLPLYYWKNDIKAGDVTGQGINGFTVATPTGGMPAPSAAASSAVTTPAPSAAAATQPPSTPAATAAPAYSY